MQPLRYPVELDRATRHFGDQVAVDNVSFDVPAGTILGVIGPSGSGKTTLIRLLTGTLEPSSGQVRVLGEDPRRFRAATREQIGYMPQTFVLYPDLTVAENVDFVAALFGLIWRRRHRRVREVLQFVELWDVRGRRAKHLSGGMQRRLELACALVHEPSLMFIDEPSAGIDPVLRQTIWDEFRRIQSLGRTLVVTTQYVAEAEYCDRVALIVQGRLLAFGTPEDLRRSALGGEVIEVETNGLVDRGILDTVPHLRAIRQAGPGRFRAVTDDAGTATPRVLEAMAERGVEVKSLHEYRPSFDEIFTELIERRDGAPSETSDAGVGAA